MEGCNAQQKEENTGPNGFTFCEAAGEACQAPSQLRDEGVRHKHGCSPAVVPVTNAQDCQAILLVQDEAVLRWCRHAHVIPITRAQAFSAILH